MINPAWKRDYLSPRDLRELRSLFPANVGRTHLPLLPIPDVFRAAENRGTAYETLSPSSSRRGRYRGRRDHWNTVRPWDRFGPVDHRRDPARDRNSTPSLSSRDRN